MLSPFDLFYPNKIQIANGATNAVNNPDKTIARLLNAPVTGPICIALAVPATWDAFPIANPQATGLRSPIKRHTTSLTDAPSIPVMITDDTVNATIPFKLSVIPIAIAVVTDIDTKERAIISPKPKKIHIIDTDKTEHTTPINTDNNIGKMCLRNNGKCLYIGTAKLTVNGTKKYVKYPALALYSEYDISNIYNTNITNIVAENSGVVNGDGQRRFSANINRNATNVNVNPK